MFPKLVRKHFFGDNPNYLSSGSGISYNIYFSIALYLKVSMLNAMPC